MTIGHDRDNSIVIISLASGRGGQYNAQSLAAIATLIDRLSNIQPEPRELSDEKVAMHCLWPDLQRSRRLAG